jgi:hypothetical protein
MSIGFRDHEGFHRAALAMTAAGAAGGLAAHAAGASVVIGGAIGAVAGASWADRPRSAARIGGRLVLVAAGGGIAAALGPWAALGVVSVAVGAALALGRPWRPWLLATVLGAAAVAAGALAAGRIDAAALTQAWPGWLTAALASAAMGLAAVVALVPRHVVIERDPVAAAIRHLSPRVDPEVAELAHQGARVWSEVRTRLDADDPGRTLVKDGVLRLVDVAARTERIPADLPDSGRRIQTRIDELDARIAAATDEVTRAQYGEARAALDDQRGYLDRIRTARDRLVARMHNYLAALEKFRLAAISVDTDATAQLAASARPALDQVAEIGADLASCGDALAEIEADAAGAGTTGTATASASAA